RVVDILVEVARERPIAAGRVGQESADPLHSDVGGLLHRLDGKVPRRLDDDTPLAAHPGDNGRPIFVVMPPPGLTLLATPPWRAAQRFRPARLGLSLVAGGLIEVIGFHRPVHLAADLIGEGGIPEPPTPTIAGADMDPQLSDNAPRGTREAQQ